ncbi:hypothetical protein [Roseinatronobacter monicus]|uniref:hypothetical protein n=1 Tax=Roseinatronobacter monicus TaxID=393481 RepID=UPI003F3AA9FF
MTTRPQNSGNPAINLTVLEEKRRAMRLQALAYLEEADRLDALYAAVTTNAPGSAAQQEVLS